MIPQINESGVLPPFLPNCLPTMRNAVAPYQATLEEFIVKYATTNARKNLLKGYLEYRRDLKDKGISVGFQWIDGSFTENVEVLRKRPPSDIDIITFFLRPEEYIENDKWEQYVKDNMQLFNQNYLKTSYHCHSFYVDMNIHPIFVVKNVTYLYGLFSHQRETFIWKGMLELDLAESETGFDDLLVLEEDHDK